jgi:hypothetical protein
MSRSTQVPLLAVLGMLAGAAYMVAFDLLVPCGRTTQIFCHAIELFVICGISSLWSP